MICLSNPKKFFFAFLFILLDMFLLVGYLVIRDATMLNELKKEVNSLSELDITRDRYNTSIKTKGDYAVVEKAIKEYLDNYAVLLQDVLQVVKDPELTNILSYENYYQDGPLFTHSLTYLDETQKDFNEKMDILLFNLEEDTIQNYIYDKTSNVYFQDVYMDLMLNGDIRKDFQETQDLLYRTKTKVNHVFDTSREILEFLVNHSDEWVLEDGEIKFQTDELYTKYVAAVSKISA